MRSGNKASLLPCLEQGNSNSAPQVDAKVFDAAAIVQMINPKTAKTFIDYSEQLFMPYVASQLEAVRCIDFVWDVYLKDSLKASVRQKRG